MYYVPLRVLREFWARMESGGRKSFRMEELDDAWLIRADGGAQVHFLEPLAADLQGRE
jgi:recombination protein U